MIREEFYVVVPDGDTAFGGVPDDQEVTFFSDADRAVRYLDSLSEQARLYVVAPVSDSGLYDWSVSTPRTTGEPMTYVNERAARNSLHGDGKLMRRRRGTNTWEEVTT